MIDFLRKKVSGRKIRYQEGEYDLDLTYITPRIIAMSIPGEGVHKMYRNSIDSVSRFLREKHHNKYRILNLSGLKYDYEKFEQNVAEYSWADHFPPPIDLLFKACQDMFSWLSLDIDNVVAVNCRAGKGRTGTLICCFFIYCGRLRSPLEAMRYYKNKRFSKGGGVTQPSQIRYVEYFAEIFFGRVRSPLIVLLDKIYIKTAPHVSGNSSKLIFEMLHENNLVYTNKKGNRDRQATLMDNWEDQILHEVDTVQDEHYVQGDIQCNLFNWGMLKIQKICRFTFNTGFIPQNLELVFSKRELDPDNFKHSKKVSDHFQVILGFRRICECSQQMLLNERCRQCKVRIDLKEQEKWICIQEMLSERLPLNPMIMLFHNPENDNIDKILRLVEMDVDDASDGSVD